MTKTQLPLRFDPSFENVPDDEVATQRGLTQAMLAIQRKMHADTGYAHRAVRFLTDALFVDTGGLALQGLTA